jgi:hypothetical protein
MSWSARSNPGRAPARWARVGGCCALFFACAAEQPDRAPLVSDRCGREICVEAQRGSGAGVVPGPATVDGGSSDVGNSDESTLLTGRVVVAITPDLENTRSLGAAFEVEVSGSGRAESTVSDVTADNGRFELALADRSPTWIALREKSESGSLLDTWLQLDRSRGEVELPILERTGLADVAQSLLLSPAELDPEMGHAILQFRDASLNPLVGVAVVPNSGIVAYDLGSTYSDSTEGTDLRGAALLLNASASSFPGSWERITVFYKGQSTELEVRLARDTVTIMNFIIEEASAGLP